MNRDCTLYGKTNIINFLGYSKIWYKALVLLLPKTPCKNKNGKLINIEKELEHYTQGFLWGFNNQSDRKIKTALIAKNTMILEKNKGGTRLIDFRLKMKAFRILLVYKYNDDKNYKWKNILRYWFSLPLRSLTNENWDNLVPHESNFDNIPNFFRQCIIDFKDYFKKHGNGIKEKTSTKIIYCNLVNEKNYIPAAIKKFPELGSKNLFSIAASCKFLDPYLREFLFKFYHCRLYFKRYSRNINDLLNWTNNSCFLCKGSLDTPVHLFMFCKYGKKLREKRNELIYKLIGYQKLLNEDNLIYGKIETKANRNKIIQYLIVLSNYLMYKLKMKKYYCPEEVINENLVMQELLLNLKKRILLDETRLKHEEFLKVWDPGGKNSFFELKQERVLIWSI